MKLGTDWKTVKDNFKLTSVLGEGSGGQVVKAVHRDSKLVVAIKKIECSFDDLNYMKYVLREIAILR
jgi:serine/threonine protein kinase